MCHYFGKNDSLRLTVRALSDHLKYVRCQFLLSPCVHMWKSTFHHSRISSVCKWRFFKKKSCTDMLLWQKFQKFKLAPVMWMSGFTLRATEETLQTQTGLRRSMVCRRWNTRWIIDETLWVLDHVFHLLTLTCTPQKEQFMFISKLWNLALQAVTVNYRLGSRHITFEVEWLQSLCWF